MAEGEHEAKVVAVRSFVRDIGHVLVLSRRGVITYVRHHERSGHTTGIGKDAWGLLTSDAMAAVTWS